jgi:hypothetical protein
MRPLYSFGADLTAAIVIGLAVPAQAALKISAAETKNMDCSNGVCIATAKNAVLNIGDLGTLLAASDVTVKALKKSLDIEVAAPFSWSGSNRLALVAYRSIVVEKPLSVAGAGGLVLNSNRGGLGGALSLGGKGKITFFGTENELTIDDAAYTLVASVDELRQAVIENTDGNFALAHDYDALGETFLDSPVLGILGNFEGLGNTISNVHAMKKAVGFFGGVGVAASIKDLNLTHINIRTRVNDQYVGGMAGLVNGGGLLSNVHFSGTVSGLGDTGKGGLAGINHGTIVNSSSNATVSNGSNSEAGGLVANNYIGGVILNSYATGDVSSPGIAGGLVGINHSNGVVSVSFATGSVNAAGLSGGLVGENDGGVTNSYATGSVTGSASSPASGGLVGSNSGTIQTSYSTGQVTAGAGFIGGLVGEELGTSGDDTDAYWDTDTSGIADLSQGAGNVSNWPGIAGLTTEQLQSGLPSGFDPAIWTEDAAVDNGLPYLIANPPK